MTPWTLADTLGLLEACARNGGLDYRLLELLESAPLATGEIERRMGIPEHLTRGKRHVSPIGRALDRLHKAGLIVRHRADRSVVVNSVAADGQALVAAVRTLHDAMLARRDSEILDFSH